ncbi:hypothetical protein K3152_14010 [Qipengyuania sp. 1NDH17]|uniref:Uncharacterized protein n=1 Tax=Qipengyuania polymorpha TaxID=2867234 RepID=A0ABS7J0L2_9SPHN|nr:hypothetical protein [Qipengyuania polymorpha]MBX7459364.1 hypothetical protein [Qipengyuania polymorpha]
MSDTQRYLSLIERQRKKLDYAPVIEAAFRDAVIDLGPNPSFTELAKWLTGRVHPSVSAKENSRWVAQQVKDWLYLDGIEPSEPNLRDFLSNCRGLPERRRTKWLRDAGFRFTAFEMWQRMKPTFLVVDGEERTRFLEGKLEHHMERTSKVARSLRSALHIPE